MTTHGSDIDRSEEWEAMKARHLRPQGERPASSARGLHHFALLCSDVERTIAFYQDLLEFPLAELFENRDYRGSTHFFFDVGHGNYLAYFDFPGLDLGEYREVLGGLHHIAISVSPEQFDRLVAKLEAAGVETHTVGGYLGLLPRARRRAPRVAHLPPQRHVRDRRRLSRRPSTRSPR